MKAVYRVSLDIVVYQALAATAVFPASPAIAVSRDIQVSQVSQAAAVLAVSAATPVFLASLVIVEFQAIQESQDTQAIAALAASQAIQASADIAGTQVTLE